MTIIEQTTESESPILAAAIYLLSVIFPFIPSSVLKIKFTPITEMFENILINLSDNAPVVRAVVSCLEYVLFAQDNAVWSSEPLCKNTFQKLLYLCLDQRPKVRKRASDAVKRILSNPPPPMMSHPVTNLTIEWCVEGLQSYSSMAATKSSSIEFFNI
jgi:ribosomal RNA-processing protein 12